MINTGTLTYPVALQLGVTGLVARASAVGRDYRRAHPSGIYREAWVQTELKRPGSNHSSLSLEEARKGDVYTRFLMRYQEVQTSANIINAVSEEIFGKKRWGVGPHLRAKPPLRATPLPLGEGSRAATG